MRKFPLRAKDLAMLPSIQKKLEEMGMQLSSKDVTKAILTDLHISQGELNFFRPGEQIGSAIYNTISHARKVNKFSY
jgi:hypothetical protein